MRDALLQPFYCSSATRELMLLCRYVRICTDDDEALQPEWEIDPKDLQIMEKVSMHLNHIQGHHQHPHAALLALAECDLAWCCRQDAATSRLYLRT